MFRIPENEYFKKFSSDYKHDDELAKFIIRLNFEENNRLVVFNDIKEYIKKNRPRFTNRYLSKKEPLLILILNLGFFFLGDKNQIEGFFKICSISKNDSHFISTVGKYSLN